MTIHVLLVEGSHLLEEFLTPGGVATDGLESPDPESLTSPLGGHSPLVLGAQSVLLLGHDLSGLVLSQVSLLESTGGLHLGALEHLPLLPDLGDPHGLLHPHGGLHL